MAPPSKDGLTPGLEESIANIEISTLLGESPEAIMSAMPTDILDLVASHGQFDELKGFVFSMSAADRKKAAQKLGVMNEAKWEFYRPLIDQALSMAPRILAKTAARRGLSLQEADARHEIYSEWLAVTNPPVQSEPMYCIYAVPDFEIDG